MEEEILKKSKAPKLRITDEDFILEEIKPGSQFYNLVFMKKTKKRNTGEVVIEPGKPYYGITFPSAVKYIYKHKTKKKFQDRNLKLEEFLKEFNTLKKELYTLLDSSLPEKRHG